ncbi:MAG TPA: amino acid ABC transporter permease [Casimicrobiaceae bacterium]|nr:amino acid ABC transporter permease [Thermoanaerobaculia bacterium]HLX30403.1 amino acid ABC transporter permease [Casimicrobiaceae bacterium]
MNWERVLTPLNIERMLVGDLFTQGHVGGLLLTVIIAAIAIVGSTILGILLGVMRASPRRAIALPALVYIQAIRSVPLLILIFWVYFVPPYFGVETSKGVSVGVALTFFTAAYIAEYIRGGILSVPNAQREAARTLGLSPVQIQLYVVLPQAFFNMIPAITGRYIVTVINTSLAFLIGLSELTDIGRQINVRLQTSPVEVYVSVMALYFIVNRALSGSMRLLENRPRFNRLFVRI